MSDFPLRGPRAGRATPAQIARLLDAEWENAVDSMEIAGIAPLASARPEDLGFLGDRRYLVGLGESAAGALLVASELAADVAGDPRPRLTVPDAHGALRLLLEFLFPPIPFQAAVHPTAIVHPSARLGEGIHLGPFAVVEEGAELGRGVAVGAHSVVGARARIGEGSLLHPHVVVYPGSVLGDRVILHSGVRVGVDGFGYVFLDGGHRKVPQVGACVVEDDVEIGANTTVDRGSIGSTRVGAGTKIDNLVQLGHNVVVGRNVVLAAQVGVAGSSRLGDGVMAGGQVGIGGHVEVGPGARLAGQAGITGDVPAGETVMGMPARPRLEFLRGVAAQARMGELLQRVRELERRVPPHPAAAKRSETGRRKGREPG